MDATEFRTGAIRPVECATEAWQIIRPNYWLLFAMCLIGIWVGELTLTILLGAIMCGIFYAMIGLIDGRPLVFADLWKGVSLTIPAAVVMLFFLVPILIVYGVIYGPLFYAVMTDPGMSQEKFLTLLTGSMLLDAVLIIAMVCFHTLLVFSFPLLIDRELTPLQAVMTSARSVWANLSGITGLIVVQMALTIIGALVLCIGIYLIVPMIFATYAVAYRKVFPRFNAC
ncbi:MAG TPA: hypothetical protein VEV84_00645 [Pyrinomonadaceae bacterium]|nr:hypothetical protein [Pyrinomonadaceae bacterium]